MKKSLLIGGLLLLFGLSACGGEVEPAEFEGVTFSSQDVYYDGEAHTIEVTNLPDFATVTYENAGPYTEIGSYDISATITATNYITLELNATLTIKPLVFTGLTMDDVEASYDNQRHSVQVRGALPEGAQVTYTSDVDGITNTAKEAGVYHVTATISAPHYETLILNATLSILKTASGLYFRNKTVKYTGQPQSITVTGSTAGNYNIRYEPANTYTDVGTYEVTAIATAPNTREWRQTATFTITEGEISASFNSQSFDYDGRNHSIKVSGNLPAGATVTYECVEDSTISNRASEIGTYTIKATINAENYATKELTATLTIKEGKVNRYIAAKDGVVYFTNPYDHNYLYILDENEDNSLSLINHDDIADIKIQDSTVLYTATSDNNKTLKGIDLNYNTSKYVANNLRGQVDYFEKYTSYETGGNIYTISGGYVYRSSNDSNGELTYTKLAYTYGSKNIALLPYNKTIYTMDNGTNYGYLMFVSATGGSSTSTASYVTMDTGTALNNRYSYRVANPDGWAHDDRNLFFNCRAYDPNSQSISGIYAYAVPYSAQATGGSFKRLCSDFGSEFTLASGDLYYLYKVNSSDLYAKNIRYVSTTGYGSSSAGTTVITASDTSKGFGGLTYAGGYLYYFDYEASGTQLIRYNISTHEKVDILAPYRNTIIAYTDILADQQTKIGVSNYTFNGTTHRNVVFQSLNDGGKVHLYDLEDEFERRLTTEQVSNFYYSNGVLLFNEIEYTNLHPNENLLFLDSTSNAITTNFISKNTGGTIILTYNSYVYTYAAGVGIRRYGYYTSQNDGTLIYNDSNKTIYNFKSSYNYSDKGLYFMQDGSLVYCSNPDAATGTSSANIQTIIEGGTIVDYLVAGTTNANQRIFVTDGECLKVHNLDGSEISTIMEGNISNLQYYPASDSIYFYNQTGDAATEGIYKINISGDTLTPELVVLSEEYAMDNFVVSKDLIAFRNYDPSEQEGDCYVYAYVISEDSLLKLGR